MIDFTIREAVPEDAEAIIEYLRVLADEPENNIGFDASSEITFTVEQERDVIQRNLDADNSGFFVAVNADGKIISVGNMSGSKRGSSRHVAALGISVLEGWRGQGVGTAMMRHMLAWARGTGIIKRIELDVFARNAGAIQLYEQLGFVTEGRKVKSYLKYGEYIDVVFMALLLWD
ncbi:MAG: GNAT family N-acetyltransferase [Anaerolineae bacterium]